MVVLIISVLAGLAFLYACNGIGKKKKERVPRNTLQGPAYKNYKESDYRDSTDLYDAEPKERVTGGAAKNKKAWEGKQTDQPIDQSKYKRVTGGAAKNKKPWEKK